MLRYLEIIIQTDLGIAPFTLVSLENTYNRKLTIQKESSALEIYLGGKIDRVDRVNEALRVIDYKTGNARLGFRSLESLFDPSKVNRNGAAFQTLFYAWLVSPGHTGEEIIPGLYVMKELYGENFNPALTIGLHNSQMRIDSFSKVEEEYLNLLRQVLNSMFDSSIPFSQTENEMKCKYCDFAAICNRAFID